MLTPVDVMLSSPRKSDWPSNAESFGPKGLGGGTNGWNGGMVNPGTVSVSSMTPRLL
jgi:hypothetical protein